MVIFNSYVKLPEGKACVGMDVRRTFFKTNNLGPTVDEQIKH